MPAIGQGRGPSFPTGSIGFKYLNLPGASGDYASTSDSVSNSVASDIDLRVLVRLSTWNATYTYAPLGKWAISGGESYLLRIENGNLRLYLNAPDAAAAGASTSKVSSSFDGKPVWVRATYSFTSQVAKYYYSTDGVSWSQLGSDVSYTRSGSITDTATDVTVGAYNNGSTAPLVGEIYHAQVYDGIAGTLVVDFDAQDADVGDTSFTSMRTGETWTVNGSAAIDRL